MKIASHDSLANAENSLVSFAKVVIREIQRNGGFKVFKFLAERIGQPRESAAVHPQRVILLLDMRRGNLVCVRHPGNDRAFRLYDL